MSPPGMVERLKQKQGNKPGNFNGVRQNMNQLNQITSLSQLQRIKVHVEEHEEDQSSQLQNKFKIRKTSFGMQFDESDGDDDGPNQVPNNANDEEQVRNVSSACSSARS